MCVNKVNAYIAVIWKSARYFNIFKAFVVA